MIVRSVSNMCDRYGNNRDRDLDSSALLRVCRREREHDRRRKEESGNGACHVSSCARSPVVGAEADPIALDDKSKVHVACVKTKDHICCSEIMNHAAMRSKTVAAPLMPRRTR